MHACNMCHGCTLLLLCDEQKHLLLVGCECHVLHVSWHPPALAVDFKGAMPAPTPYLPHACSPRDRMQMQQLEQTKISNKSSKKLAMHHK
eukprot:scaffold88401_cov19-Tisochrysis_lutea.AAC.2